MNILVSGLLIVGVFAIAGSSTANPTMNPLHKRIASPHRDVSG
jgi:hypothetical protein